MGILVTRNTSGRNALWTGVSFLERWTAVDMYNKLDQQGLTLLIPFCQNSGCIAGMTIAQFVPDGTLDSHAWETRRQQRSSRKHGAKEVRVDWPCVPVLGATIGSRASTSKLRWRGLSALQQQHNTHAQQTSHKKERNYSYQLNLLVYSRPCHGQFRKQKTCVLQLTLCIPTSRASGRCVCVCVWARVRACGCWGKKTKNQNMIWVEP